MRGNGFKTFLLLTVLTSLCLWGGYALAGNVGIVAALILSGVMNLGAYWFSARFILRLYDAREVSLLESPYLFRLVRGVSRAAGLLVPRVYLIPENAPNAFDAGRNQQHGIVAVTEGLLRALDEEELEAVLAHELAHIRNRDTLPASGNPLALASALEKIERESRLTPFYTGSLETAHLFVRNPFPNARFSRLFRAHPSTAERVRRLRAMAHLHHLAA